MASCNGNSDPPEGRWFRWRINTHTTYDWNEELEEDKEEENVQAIEPEPQGLADKGERIPGIVEGMEKEDQDAQIMEQCGDSSDGKNDERFPVLGEWRKEGFGNPVVQDIRCPDLAEAENYDPKIFSSSFV